MTDGLEPTTPTSKMKQGKISGFYSTRRSALREQAKSITETTKSTSHLDITTATTRFVAAKGEERVVGGMVGYPAEGTETEVVTRTSSTIARVKSAAHIGLVKAPTKRKAAGATKTINKADEPAIDRQSLPTNRVITSRTKSAGSTVPAYEAPPEPFAVAASDRFSALLAPSTTRLTLPAKFQLLQRIHSALETVLQLMADRDQPAVFHRAKKAAENIVGREITVEHMGQIYGLLGPASYQFKPSTIVHLGKRTASFAVSFTKRLSQSELVQRRDAFHSALLAHVRSTHDIFLAEIGVKLPTDAKLRSWHPKFDLDTVPDLPVREVLPVDRKELLKTTPNQVKDAIKEVERESLSDSLASTPSPSPRKKQASLAPMSLLERIKAKEAVQVTKDMISSPTHEPEHTGLAEFAQSLAFLFGTSGKGALPLADVTLKLGLGSKAPLSNPEIVQRIKRLAESVPDWIQLVSSGTLQIVRVDKAYGVKRALSELSTKLIR